MNAKRLAGPAFSLTLYGVAIALIVAVTWPWALHFDGEMIGRWDPPFHAWKLEFMARRILAGDPLFFNRETTLLYPNTGTLYFEALQWPASLLGALFFALTDWSPEKIYHIVMLLMWGLSAPCMHAFLSRAGLSRPVSAAASLVFCILPYRISYVDEFQMQFAFGTPLVYLAILSFFSRPGAWRGAAVAAAMWLYAVTELNQAVFIVFTFPFLAAAFLVANPRLLSDRRFWTGAAAAAATAALLVPLLLWPYAQQFMAGAVNRELAEVDRHSVQVLSFLRPFGRVAPWGFSAKTEEWIAYPTLAMSLLAAVGGCALVRASLRDRSAPRWRRWAPVPLVLISSCFLALTAAFQCSVGNECRPLVRAWGGITMPLAATALFACFSAGGDSPRHRILPAFAGAAVFCALLTTGPYLGLTVENGVFRAPNRLYLELYRHGPFLSGFRAACRFGVFVHFGMLVLAAWALDRICLRTFASNRGSGRRRIALECVLGLAFVSAVAVEALPPGKFVETTPVDRPDDCPVIARLARRPDPFTLAVLPMGKRNQDGRTMFSILKNRFNAFYAWCGYVPPETEAVKNAVTKGDYATACEALGTLWPDCLLLVDSAKRTRASPRYAAAFPGHVTTVRGSFFVDYVAALSPHATVVDHDDRFTLMALNRATVGTRFRKRFRTDFGRSLPEASLSIGPSEATLAVVRLNDGPEERFALEPGRAAEIRVRIPPERLVSSGANELAISLDAPARLSGFELRKPR